MLSTTLTRTARSSRPQSLRLHLRGLSTLPQNPQIYVHPHPLDPTKHILSHLPTSPPTPRLAIGTTTSLPVTPSSFTPNPAFLPLLSSVLAAHAPTDPAVAAQAAVFASPGGFNIAGSGSASGAGGAGGASVGGWIHVSDTRNPPDFGRIAWPEDILGSLEVDGKGKVVQGSWQDSGSYRVVTREGVLGLTAFVWGKVVERLRAEEAKGEEGKA
ncbi:hypothetical protein C7974DRAFT_425692 [Boeremia exigua]|uniref:uncharacterized protein n=1 Tax=Boeremia exigua TaxID=749465 RepID=UPI001E8EF089|nr:uncharacterized protein C7974DRAFT_425692 [Boeremia exigua]KAH6621946.1 hypothetical protein C7974DRAFT_425692 [Boeremia exigua]